MIRRLIVSLTAAIVTVHAGQVLAQGAFPAPLPNQSAPANASPFPPVNGAAPSAAVGAPSAFPSQGSAPVSSGFSGPPPQASGGADVCMKGFVPLREEAERRGKLIKAASDRKAPPDEACKLIKNFGQAETKMIQYVETNSAKCGIPPQIADQLRNGHKNTEKMQKQVCTMAQGRATSGPHPLRSLINPCDLNETRHVRLQPEWASPGAKSGSGIFDFQSAPFLA